MEVEHYETLCAFASRETDNGYLKTLVDLHFANGQVITGFRHDVDSANFLIPARLHNRNHRHRADERRHPAS